LLTDYEKWRDASQTWGAQNPSRAQYTASIIPEDVSVLDIGAGSMILRQHLKPSCRYTPCDIHDRGEGCLVADLNKGEFPPGRYDWITMVGVLEYIVDVGATLRKASQSASHVLCSYNLYDPDGEPSELRASRGWLNHITAAEMLDIIRSESLQLLFQPSERWYVIAARQRPV
jgi:2-polyprenyl-3-methyl-5-hydroxy-6-metoxy-1,4-benzoquinol methylase